MGVSPNIPRTFAFIDGENLVMRYQAMLSDGRVPTESVVHRQDTFVWSRATGLQGHFDLIRAYFFTSAVGSEDVIHDVEDALNEIPFGISLSPLHINLYAQVFKKPRQSSKSKNVDIGIAAELLMHTYKNDLDAALVFSGDGDLIPIVKKVADAGKRVIVYAFKSGFNKGLSRVADRTFFLDDAYFQSR